MFTALQVLGGCPWLLPRPVFVLTSQDWGWQAADGIQSAYTLRVKSVQEGAADAIAQVTGHLVKGGGCSGSLTVICVEGRVAAWGCTCCAGQDKVGCCPLVTQRLSLVAVHLLCGPSALTLPVLHKQSVHHALYVQIKGWWLTPCLIFVCCAMACCAMACCVQLLKKQHLSGSLEVAQMRDGLVVFESADDADKFACMLEEEGHSQVGEVNMTYLNGVLAGNIPLGQQERPPFCAALGCGWSADGIVMQRS